MLAAAIALSRAASLISPSASVVRSRASLLALLLLSLLLLPPLVYLPLRMRCLRVLLLLLTSSGSPTFVSFPRLCSSL